MLKVEIHPDYYTEKGSCTISGLVRKKQWEIKRMISTKAQSKLAAGPLYSYYVKTGKTL